MMRRVGELKAEVERLNAVIESHKDAGLRILAMLDEERRLTKHLKAEVERAGHTLENLNVWYDEALDKNDNLKAEVERLTAFTTRTIIPNEELQAHIERLTKAGDQLSADVLLVFGENKDVDDWNAAKEGKPRD
jgi:hypothetical protein